MWQVLSEEKNFEAFVLSPYSAKIILPSPTAAMFFDESKFRKQFLKRVTQGTILFNYSKFWPAVSEKKTF